VGCDLQGLKVR